MCLNSKFISIFSIIVLLFPIIPYHNASAVSITPSFITMDISSSPNSNDFPYGIDCSDPNYVYVTIFAQGALGRIDKTTQAFTLFDNDNVASGEDWYSTVRDPSSGKIFINEKDTGRLRVFDPTSSTFATVPIPENVAGGVISYTTTYAANPNRVTVNEGVVLGNHIYDFGFNSYGELRYANGYIWQVIDYSYDFSTASEAAGAVDVNFHGIARIDPSDNSVTRYAISGASSLRGTVVDSSDSTILWLTDISADKIFKFNTNTHTVTQTISLASGSMARGIANDGTNLYVALNKNSGGTSEILQIDKSNTVSQTTIDTGKSNTSAGTFTVFVDGTTLYWTDQSAHTGAINLKDGTKVSSNTSDTSSNHFGCKVGNEFWFAGHGSAKIGTFADPFGSGGEGGCRGDCTPPTTKTLTVNDNSFQVSGYYTPMPLQTLEVGKENTFILSGTDNSGAANIRHSSLCLDIPKDQFSSDQNSCILYDIAFNGLTHVSVIDKENNLVDVSVSSGLMDNTLIVTYKFKVSNPMTPNKISTQFWDEARNVDNHYYNHGIEAVGVSLNPPDIISVQHDGNRFSLSPIQNNDLRIDQDGHVWKMLSDSNWYKLTNGLGLDQSEKSPKVLDRYYDGFAEYKSSQEKLAHITFASHYGNINEP